MSDIELRQSLDNGLSPAASDFTGGTLQCLCADDKGEVTIAAQTLQSI